MLVMHADQDFFPPYRGTRYHLREYGTRSPQNARELFNLRHSSLRVTVDRAFGALRIGSRSCITSLSILTLLKLS